MDSQWARHSSAVRSSSLSMEVATPPSDKSHTVRTRRSRCRQSANRPEIAISSPHLGRKPAACSMPARDEASKSAAGRSSITSDQINSSVPGRLTPTGSCVCTPETSSRRRASARSKAVNTKSERTGQSQQVRTSSAPVPLCHAVVRQVVPVSDAWRRRLRLGDWLPASSTEIAGHPRRKEVDADIGKAQME